MLILIKEREDRARKRMTGEDKTEETSVHPTLKEQCEQMPVTIRAITSQSNEAKDQTVDNHETGDEIDDSKSHRLNIPQEVNSEFKSNSETSQLSEKPVELEEDFHSSRDLGGSQNDNYSSQIEKLQTSENNTDNGVKSDSENVKLTGNTKTTEHESSRNLQALPSIDDLQIKFGKQAMSFNFTKNVAAMAAAQSHNIAGLNVETFGDSDDSEDDEEGVYEQ